MSDLRVVHAGLREVVADKDELIASQDTVIRALQDQLAATDELLGEQAQLIALVQEQNAKLRRRWGRDSTNSSTPPSAGSIAAKATRRRANCQRARSTNRRSGGQQGHLGSGLELAAEVDETVPVEPAQCSTCGEHLDADAECAGFTPVQQWDIPLVEVRKVQFDVLRRRWWAGQVTQAECLPRLVPP